MEAAVAKTAPRARICKRKGAFRGARWCVRGEVWAVGWWLGRSGPSGLERVVVGRWRRRWLKRPPVLAFARARGPSEVLGGVCVARCGRLDGGWAVVGLRGWRGWLWGDGGGGG